MTTVKDVIIEKELIMAQQRLAKLQEMGAPKVVIDSLGKQIQKLQAGNIKIGGENDLLDCEYKFHIVRQGRGGKSYILFNNWVKYFPNAKYGRYITK